MLTSEQFERLEALLQKATPGPWVTDGDDTLHNGNLGGIYIAQAGNGRVGQTFANCLADDEACRANAALIAEAINALPALLQLARAVQSAPKASVIGSGESLDGRQIRVVGYVSVEGVDADALHALVTQTVALVPVPVKEGIDAD